jgi:hypothetical protein
MPMDAICMTMILLDMNCRVVIYSAADHLINPQAKANRRRKLVLRPSMRRPVGVKWVLLFFRWTRFFSRRVASVAILPSALLMSDFSLGANWAFSFQPVLPPDYRPAVPSQRIEPGPGHRRSHRNSAFGAFDFFLLRGFDFMLPRAALPGCSCATVRTLLRSPTGDAAAPRAFSLSQ